VCSTEGKTSEPLCDSRELLSIRRYHSWSIPDQTLRNRLAASSSRTVVQVQSAQQSEWQSFTLHAPNPSVVQPSEMSHTVLNCMLGQTHAHSSFPELVPIRRGSAVLSLSSPLCPWCSQLKPVVLHLRPRKKKKVVWKEGTVDNEHMNKKSSKSECIAPTTTGTDHHRQGRTQLKGGREEVSVHQAFCI